MIPYGRQEITQADIDAVSDVLRSDYLTQGPAVPQFEQAVAAYVNVKYALAVNSATSALHVACLALGLGSGDWLWTSPITFVASANCGLYCGASIDFVDIDPATYTLCPRALAQKLERAEKEGRLPKIVIPVHLCGQSCDMEAIYALSKRYGFKIIEDASHAIGAKYKGEWVGNCRYSDIAVFSFHPVKIITTGEGGMAVTNTPELAHNMALLRSHGITRDAAYMTHAPDGPWYYQQIDLGYNYRMTDIQAALGISQLGRLDAYVSARHAIANRYNQALEKLPLTLPHQHKDAFSSYHLYVVRLELDNIRKTHRQVFEELREQGIGVNLHYIPVYRQPHYMPMGFARNEYPNAEDYYSEAISLPMYAMLTPAQQDRVIEVLTRVVAS